MAQHYFKFAARVLKHLGEELISSDDVALYELVKNGFDATIDAGGPGTVRVDIVYRIDIERVAQWRGLLERAGTQALDRDEAIRLLSQPGPFSEEDQHILIESLPRQASGMEMSRSIANINRIAVTDTGIGMSSEELDEYFLTVGTTHRLLQLRERPLATQAPATPVLAGEKGIGRLSMMRLGRAALVRTSKSGIPTEQWLEIDWRPFDADQPLQAQNIPVELRSTPRLADSPPSGTTIVVFDLRSPWDQSKARDVAQRFLSKFLNPFDENPTGRHLLLTWNGSPVEIPRIGRVFLDAAQNGFRAEMGNSADAGVVVKTRSWFTTTAADLKKVSDRTYSELDFGGIAPQDFASVGPFEVQFYHYNRRRVKALPGVATRQEVVDWLDEWSGGLKLYRDGIRVMPYGQAPASRRQSVGVVQRSSSDDWLGLDSDALRGRGFRVNRIQVVGCVQISRIANPELRDQANREGLLDNPASRSLVAILKALVRQFVADLDESVRPKEGDFEALHEAAVASQEDFERAVEDLVEAASSGDTHTVSQARDRVRASLQALRAVIDDTQLALQERQLNRIEIVELAATGIAAESFAHDLEASLDHAMDYTARATRVATRESPLAASLTHLRAVLKSLRTQISSIKPGPARHRRRRSEVDLVDSLIQIETYYRTRFDRHGITFRVELRPPDAEFHVNVVEGHIRQVFDNLIRNSIYWLRETRVKTPHRKATAEIDVVLDARSGTATFGDSGIGIAKEDTDWVFGRFNTRRERGRGLGLYLSRELCDFNGIRLELDPGRVNEWGRLSHFVLDFGSAFRQVRE